MSTEQRLRNLGINPDLETENYPEFIKQLNEKGLKDRDPGEPAVTLEVELETDEAG